MADDVMKRSPAPTTAEGEEEEGEEEEEEEENEEEGGNQEILYDAKEFEDLAVGSDVKQVFSYISLYTPRDIELELKLKPFIPDFMPAVGDIDAFIKVPRPDGLDDGLGLRVLDEPSASRQSDASLLALRLRAVSKDLPLDSNQAVKVRTAAGPKDIDAWINSLRQLHHETRGAPVVQTLLLPAIDHLMQEWDPEFEEALSTLNLPPPDLDCSLPEYVTIICSLLDIPIHGSQIPSLHQLFTLYNEFRSSQHFKHLHL